MNENLVSLIIPCYNSQKTIARCLDSVLAQTWSNMEVIVVNDGSTDGSESIILSYKDRMYAKGAKLKYIRQENRGLGGAIDTGLKYFTGDFLCWFDSDDFLYPDSVRVKAEYLLKNSDVAGVTTDADIFLEGDFSKPIGRISDGNSDLYQSDQFSNIIKQKGIICQGCQMLRSKDFLEANPTRTIYPSRNGQNLQMLLPTLYKRKHAFIPLSLYGYVVNDNSMMHRKKSNKELVDEQEEYQRIVIKTLDSFKINIFKKYWCKKIVKQKKERNLLYIYISERKYFRMFISLFYMTIFGELKRDDFELVLRIKKVKNRGFK